MVDSEKEDDNRYADLLAQAMRFQREGASQEQILAVVRNAWPSPIQSIKILRDLFGLPLSEAKTALHSSSAWADQVSGWEALHDQLEAAFDRTPSHSESPNSNPRVPCPACGYLTFTEPPGSYAVCRVCNCEDDALQLEFATSLAGGANAYTLAEAQLRFLRTADRLLRARGFAAHPPPRDLGWRPVDPARDRFPDWHSQDPARAPAADESLYYWRDSFWHRDAAS